MFQFFLGFRSYPNQEMYGLFKRYLIQLKNWTFSKSHEVRSYAEPRKVWSLNTKKYIFIWYDPNLRMVLINYKSDAYKQNTFSRFFSKFGHIRTTKSMMSWYKYYLRYVIRQKIRECGAYEGDVYIVWRKYFQTIYCWFFHLLCFIFLLYDRLKTHPAERNAIKSTTNNGVTRNQRTKRSKQGNPKAVSSSATLDFSRVAVRSKQRNPKAVLSSRQR